MNERQTTKFKKPVLAIVWFYSDIAFLVYGQIQIITNVLLECLNNMFSTDVSILINDDPCQYFVI